MCLNPQVNPKVTLNPHLRPTSAWAGAYQPGTLSHVTNLGGQSPCLGHGESFLPWATGTPFTPPPAIAQSQDPDLP